MMGLEEKSLFLFFWLAMRHVGSYFPNQGWNPSPLQWTHEVVTTGPLGRSNKCELILTIILAGQQECRKGLQ